MLIRSQSLTRTTVILRKRVLRGSAGLRRRICALRRIAGSMRLALIYSKLASAPSPVTRHVSATRHGRSSLHRLFVPIVWWGIFRERTAFLSENQERHVPSITIRQRDKSCVTGADSRVWIASRGTNGIICAIVRHPRNAVKQERSKARACRNSDGVAFGVTTTLTPRWTQFSRNPGKRVWKERTS